MFRVGIGATGGAAVFTYAQGKYLHSKYQPLPEARGPLRGVVAWRQSLPASPGSRQPLQWWKSQLSSQQKDAGHAESGFQPLHAAVRTAAVSWLRQRDPGMVAAAARSQKNILFVGDSLITGVGQSQESSSGPALPRVIAEFLSKHLRVDVQWAAIGETGCDLETMRANLVPAVAGEVRRVRAEGQHIDLVVVICGLNDVKKAYQSSSATASNFRTELSKYCAPDIQLGLIC